MGILGCYFEFGSGDFLLIVFEGCELRRFDFDGESLKEIPGFLAVFEQQLQNFGDVFAVVQHLYLFPNFLKDGLELLPIFDRPDPLTGGEVVAEAGQHHQPK